MQRAPSDAESSTFLGCRRQIRRISNTSCRKSFLKLRSDWAGCRFPPKLWANPACGLCMARHWAPAAPVGLRIGPGLLRSRRAALASHPCARPGLSHLAPPALIACAPQRGANRSTPHSLKPRGQYGCSAVKSGQAAAWLPSHCPRFMPCTRCAQTNRPPVRAQTMSGISQTAGAFCSSGGEGSWPALGGQLACS